LQHLEILEAAVEGGSLLKYVDHCKTGFGRR
jgi:hypothetical protein